MENTKITLSKGGTEERTVEARDITVPDLWHVAMFLKDYAKTTPNPLMLQKAADEILETWHLAHDLLRHIKEEGKATGEPSDEEGSNYSESVSEAVERGAK